MSVEKLYISYNEIHQAIADCVNEKNVYEVFKPTLIIAIGSGAWAWWPWAGANVLPFFRHVLLLRSKL